MMGYQSVVKLVDLWKAKSTMDWCFGGMLKANQRRFGAINSLDQGMGDIGDFGLAFVKGVHLAYHPLFFVVAVLSFIAIRVARQTKDSYSYLHTTLYV